MLNYKYKETKKIEKLLGQIEAMKVVFKSLTPDKKLKENIRRESLLKSALFSAKIEGNKLRITDVESQKKSKNRDKLEVFNLFKAYQYVFNKKSKLNLTVKEIKKIHRIVMTGLIPTAGQFRQKPGAVFNLRRRFVE